MKKIEDAIRENGVCIIFTRGDVAGTMLNMAYTIGLADIGHPEVFVFALSAESAHGILNDVAKRAREGALLVNERLLELASMPITLKPVEPAVAADYIVQANVRAGRDLPALQLVWPDPEGRFPWEKDFDKRYAAAQPPLYGVAH